MKKGLCYRLHRIGLLTLLAMSGAFLSACVNVRTPAVGFLYTEVKGPISVTSVKHPTKSGTACASSILGLWATGDASVEAATAGGEITEISWVDEDAYSLLFGVYGTYCVTVRGN